MYSISINQILRLSSSVKMYFNNEIRRNICSGFFKDTEKIGSTLFRLRLLKMDRFKIKIKNSASKEKTNPRLPVNVSRSVINVEKNMIPNHVLMFNVEDEILQELNRCSINDRSRKRISENEKLVEISSKRERWSTMTPVEYNQWRRTAAVVEEKSTSTVLPSGAWQSEDTHLQKRGLLTFFTHLPNLRQTRVPHVGFASSSTQPVDDAGSREKTNLKVGKDLKLKEGPFVKSGSQKRSEFIASLAPETFPAGSNTMGFNSTLKGTTTPSASEPHDVNTTPADKVTEKASVDRTSPRLDAELKECAIMTRHRTLTDATTLIGPRTDTPAPHTLLKLRNHPDHTLGDPELRVLLKKYKTLKLKEIDYHLAQIKKHRKQLMELMVKKPYQTQEDSDKRS